MTHVSNDVSPVRISARRGRPIRVAHLLHTMAHGGVETAIINWCREFRPDVVEPHLICFANPGETEWPFVDAAGKAGFRVVKVPWGNNKPILKAARQVAAYLRRNECDVIHCHNTYANVVGLLAAKLARVKTLTTMYVWGNFGWKRGALQKIDELLMKRFDRVTAHCESCFHDTVKRGIPSSELDLLICGYPVKDTHVSPEARSARRADFGAGPENIVLIYMARFWPEKAHDNLLGGLRMLAERHPRVRLWLPGVGPELDRIKAMCSELGVDRKVRFLGFQADPDLLLSLADIQVHPSDNEGVALAICTGMNAGLPIVTSRVGGLPEVLKDGKNSILIPPRNPEAFVRAVSGLIENPAEARRLGAEARRFIHEEYSLEVATRRVEAVYSALLEGRT